MDRQSQIELSMIVLLASTEAHRAQCALQREHIALIQQTQSDTEPGAMTFTVGVIELDVGLTEQGNDRTAQ